MKRKASAVWNGGLKAGKGAISTESGVLSSTQYSFGTRFENGPGTNPEELIAAAHAGCFSMALSAQLESASLTANIPGATPEQFATAAASAKAGCPVSRVLKADITMDAKLAS